MLVLIDASGSMLTPRPGGTDRFADAKASANNRINFYAGQGPVKVAVYTFQGFDTPPLSHTGNAFIDSNQAKDAIDCLVANPPADPCAATPDHGAPFFVEGSTPLAGGMCLSALKLLEANSGNDTMIMQISSDGLENATFTEPCAGPTGLYNPVTTHYDPADSWQQKVIGFFLNKHITVHTDLFEIETLSSFSRPAANLPDLEDGLTHDARLLAPAAASTAAAAANPLTELEQFFTILAQTTGGQVTVAHDDEPLPLLGDLNADRCIDHGDAILVARAFGPVGKTGTGRFDLDVNGTVGFTDYALERSLSTPSCPDAFAPRAPLVCKDAKQVVIDGQSIEDAGVTIDASNGCDIVIRNSLLVSGKNAITIVGSAKVTVDSSVIVGENAVILSRGSSVLSAANSVFHGKLDAQGTFQYIDRGGNTFEVSSRPGTAN